jgi:hypothetical protein
LITDDVLDAFRTTATYDDFVPKVLKHHGGITTRATFAIPT